jgi:DNA polymerase
MAYAMAFPGSLEKAAAAAGISKQKDLAGGRVMLQLSKPRGYAPDGTPIFWEYADAPEKFETMYSYCITDVDVEHLLFKRLMQLSPKEREIWMMDYRINQRGVFVDRQAVANASAIIEDEKIRLSCEIFHRKTLCDDPRRV